MTKKRILIALVAPYVGAWIETTNVNTDNVDTESHPMWVRGLKLVIMRLPLSLTRSHPMWVRGLKLCIIDALKWAFLRRTLCGCVD